MMKINNKTINSNNNHSNDDNELHFFIPRFKGI
jgi:hypothetical protein